jgi:hypothetical protein
VHCSAGEQANNDLLVTTVNTRQRWGQWYKYLDDALSLAQLSQCGSLSANSRGREGNRLGVEKPRGVLAATGYVCTLFAQATSPAGIEDRVEFALTKPITAVIAFLSGGFNMVYTL